MTNATKLNEQLPKVFPKNTDGHVSVDIYELAKMAERKNLRDTVIVYHSDCLDGKLAAWAAFRTFDIEKEWPVKPEPGIATPAARVFQQKNGFALIMQEAVYGDKLRDYTGSDVYILDFSFKVHELMNCAETANTVTVLDHHLSLTKAIKSHHDQLLKKASGDALEIDPKQQLIAHSLTTVEEEEGIKILNGVWFNYKKNLRIFYDVERAGSTITWAHFNPRENVPDVLKYGEDHDLYSFGMPESRNISAALHTELLIPEGFNVITELHERWSTGTRFKQDECYYELVAIGRAVRRHTHHVVTRSIERNASTVSIGPYKGIPINICVRQYRSYMGELMAKDVPFSITYEDIVSEGIREYSFRSDKNDPRAVDVEAFAALFGGGGHKNASGVRLPIGTDLVWPT